ncbi:MAG: hypothetical protein ABL970_11205, partial [Nitrospira sp.]
MRRLVVQPIVSAMMLASTVGLIGCSTAPFPPARATVLEESRRAAKVIQDREQELTALRSEMAATKIAAAKQEAERQELRALVAQLRRENGEGRQATLEATRQAEVREAELAAFKAEREQVVAVKPTEPTQHDRQLAVLEATVNTLT